MHKYTKIQFIKKISQAQQTHNNIKQLHQLTKAMIDIVMEMKMFPEQRLMSSTYLHWHRYAVSSTEFTTTYEICPSHTNYIEQVL
jgi:hypothetical protein